MVGVAGRSKGCYTCRRRKVKCDETHPTCERCTKAKVPCGGYPLGLNFIDEKGRAQKRVLIKRQACLEAVQAEEKELESSRKPKSESTNRLMQKTGDISSQISNSLYQEVNPRLEAFEMAVADLTTHHTTSELTCQIEGCHEDGYIKSTELSQMLLNLPSQYAPIKSLEYSFYEREPCKSPLFPMQESLDGPHPPSGSSKSPQWLSISQKESGEYDFPEGCLLARDAQPGNEQITIDAKSYTFDTGGRKGLAAEEYKSTHKTIDSSKFEDPCKGSGRYIQGDLSWQIETSPQMCDVLDRVHPSLSFDWGFDCLLQDGIKDIEQESQIPPPPTQDNRLKKRKIFQAETQSNELPDSLQPKKLSKPSSRPFRCDVCTKSFTKCRGLATHKASHRRHEVSVVGKDGMPSPAPNPLGNQQTFTLEEDILMAGLKSKGLTWHQIQEFFPGRSLSTLQSHYCKYVRAETELMDMNGV